MSSVAKIVFVSCLVGAHAAFNCTLYAATCSGVTNYEAYQNCASTVAQETATSMTCRTTHLGLAAVSGAAAVTHCAHAAPTAGAPCNTSDDELTTFMCGLYASTCSGETNYEAYKMCASTVAVNDANSMACRINHLLLAATSGNSALHCPHAAPTAAAPCNTEMLKGFDCALYASTCSGVANYSAYANCAGTVTANGANGMACRIQHLKAAAASGGAALHCPHAAPAATGPCATENITLAVAAAVTAAPPTTAAPTTAAPTNTTTVPTAPGTASAAAPVSLGLGLLAALSASFA